MVEKYKNLHFYYSSTIVLYQASELHIHEIAEPYYKVFEKRLRPSGEKIAIFQIAKKSCPNSLQLSLILLQPPLSQQKHSKSAPLNKS